MLRLSKILHPRCRWPLSVLKKGAPTFVRIAGELLFLLWPVLHQGLTGYWLTRIILGDCMTSLLGLESVRNDHKWLGIFPGDFFDSVMPFCYCSLSFVCFRSNLWHIRDSMLLNLLPTEKTRTSESTSGKKYYFYNTSEKKRPIFVFWL